MSFVCDDHEFRCRIIDEASICTAELLAIEAAIEYIWDSSDEEFMFITDSLSSLQALKSQKLNNPIVSNILHMCHYLSGHKDIVFCWVPSLIGIQGNERTDVLAKAALDKTKQFYYIPYTDFKYNISVYLDDILQGEWDINVTSKLFEVQPIIKRSFTPMERRRDDVVLCRARIGHAYFTNGYLLRGELRPMCCNTRLTVRHVLLSCAKYAHIRRKYFAFNSLFELFREPLLVLSFSSFGNVTYIICFNYKTHTCSFYTITPISWRYSDLISRSFYNHFIFYIIYADIFILIKLCCSAGATTCHQTRYI